MEQIKLKSATDVSDLDIDDIEKLLAQLTPEQIDELNGDFDPDVS